LIEQLIATLSKKFITNFSLKGSSRKFVLCIEGKARASAEIMGTICGKAIDPWGKLERSPERTGQCSSLTISEEQV
jgi:hypothetical protein